MWFPTQYLSVQNLTVFFHFCSIHISINQFMDHIITFSLAWNFRTKTNRENHLPTNLLHSRRIPTKTCFLSSWKSIVPAAFLYSFEMPVPFPYLHNTFCLLLAPRTFDQVTSPFKESSVLSQLPYHWLPYCRTYFNDPILFWLHISERWRQCRTSPETGSMRLGWRMKTTPWK